MSCKYIPSTGSFDAELAVVFPTGATNTQPFIEFLNKQGFSSLFITCAMKIMPSDYYVTDDIMSWRDPLISELNKGTFRGIIFVGAAAMCGLNLSQHITEIRGKIYRMSYLPAPVMVVRDYEVNSLALKELKEDMDLLKRSWY